MDFSTIDLTVFISYILLMVGFGIWIANKTGNESSKDYFLASGALPWWAVGGSLIASNISTEQILIIKWLQVFYKRYKNQKN